MTEIFCLVGLGNPGPSYAQNRHNIGFMALDRLSEDYPASAWRLKHQAQLCELKLPAITAKILLAKPQTYMNASGQCVQEVLRFYKIPLSHLIVIHDELDLAPGKLRIKTGGGAGGHNGLKSIDRHCGNLYQRVRLGIGHPGHKDQVASYVLHDFSKQEQEWLDPLLTTLSRNIHDLFDGQSANLMNKAALALAPKES
jgi:PTH1 family peptidyl-tRNA hydrolase